MIFLVSAASLRRRCRLGGIRVAWRRRARPPRHGGLIRTGSRAGGSSGGLGVSASGSAIAEGAAGMPFAGFSPGFFLR